MSTYGGPADTQFKAVLNGPPMAESRARGSRPQHGKRRYALIAGADAGIRQLLRTVLEIGDFEVVEAGNQGEVLARLASNDRAPDVVILDVLLPTFSGLATLSYLCREPRLARVPVVVLTSFTDAPDHARFSQSGATAVMSKPFSSTRLLSTLNEVVGARN
jgi:CheY-like chemotaxis protein